MRRLVGIPMRRLERVPIRGKQMQTKKLDLGEVIVASSNVKKAVAGSSADASRCSKIIHSFKASNRGKFNFIFLI